MTNPLLAAIVQATWQSISWGTTINIDPHQYKTQRDGAQARWLLDLAMDALVSAPPVPNLPWNRS